MLTFYHSGNVGDIIASLAWCRAKCEERDDKATYVLEYGHPAIYVGQHPLGNTQLSREWAEKLAPLLLAQPYILDVTYKQCDDSSNCFTNKPKDRNFHNLNMVRRKNLNLGAGDLRRWYFQVYPCDWCACRPWLTVEPDHRFADAVLVNRTTRYKNTNVTYHFLQHCKRPVVFVGLAEEFDLFRNAVPLATHFQADNFLQLAQVIRGGRCFVGCQSSCWWLAEAQAVPRLLEVYGPVPNCLPLTPNGWDAHHQEQFEQIFNRLAK